MSKHFNIGDYIEGIESYGGRERVIRGTIGKICGDRLDIRADDGYNGARGTSVDADTAYLCNRVEDWRTAQKRVIPVGTTVRHFKNKLYKIIGYANHVDGGRVVIYMALYGDFTVYVREYTEFMSRVDKVKYPEVEQIYRFEEI